MFRSVNPACAFLVSVLFAAALTGCSSVPTAAAPLQTVSATVAPAPPARLALADARGLIKGWLAREVPNYNLEILNELKEIDFGVDALFEATGTQYYTLNNSYYGIYFGSVFPLGFLSLLSAQAADVDGDGRCEAVLLVDTGSGRYIRQLYVVKDGVLYREFINDSGGQQGYRLAKAASGEVVLYKALYDANGNAAGEDVAGVIGLVNGGIVLNHAGR